MKSHRAAMEMLQKGVKLMFSLTPAFQALWSFYVKVPELGLESLSRWNVLLGSGVGGESRSTGMSQERVDHRELLPLPGVPSPELLPQSSRLL